MNKKRAGIWVVLFAFVVAAFASLAHADGNKKKGGSGDTPETDPRPVPDPQKDPPKPPEPPKAQDSPTLADLQAQVDQLQARKADLEKQVAAQGKPFDGNAANGGAATVGGSTNTVTADLSARAPKIPIAAASDAGGGAKKDSPGWWSTTGKHLPGPILGVSGLSTLLIGIIGMSLTWMGVGAGILLLGLILGPILETFT